MLSLWRKNFLRRSLTYFFVSVVDQSVDGIRQTFILNDKSSFQIDRNLVENSSRKSLDLNVLRIETNQALEVVEDWPVPDDGPIDRILGEVDDTAEAGLYDLLPADTVNNLNAVGGLEWNSFV